MIRQTLHVAFLIFWGILLAFSEYMGIVPFKLADIKFYGADFILVIGFAIMVLYGFGSLMTFRARIF